MTLLPIGRFSGMTRLSVKALRLYDEKGLLTPAVVDPSTGYRYYEVGQAGRAEAIRVLRSVEMPLDEIAELLDADDPEVIHKLLLMHRERLGEQLAAQERSLAYLESLINREEGIMDYQIEIVEAAPQRVAAVKKHSSMRTIGDDIQAGFGSLMSVLGRGDASASGSPLLVFHDVIDDQTDGAVEICLPIDRYIPGNGEVYERQLEGGTLATTIHRGPYEEIAPAYQAVTGWISAHGHEIAGPPREVYLNNPTQVPSDQLLTRVEFPIHPDSK